MITSKKINRPVIVGLDDEMISQAYKNQKDMINNKGGMFNSYSDLCDVIGSLAQQAVAYQMMMWGLKPENSDFFQRDINSDEFDFMWRYEKVDVKGSPFGEGWHIIYPKTRFLIEQNKENIHFQKGINRYVFVKIDLKLKKAIIAGIISFNRFWEQAVREDSGNWKVPTAWVSFNDLESFEDFVLT